MTAAHTTAGRIESTVQHAALYGLLLPSGMPKILSVQTFPRARDVRRQQQPRQLDKLEAFAM